LSGPRAPMRSWRASLALPSGPPTRGPRNQCHEPWLQDTSPSKRPGPQHCTRVDVLRLSKAPTCRGKRTQGIITRCCLLARRMLVATSSRPETYFLRVFELFESSRLEFCQMNLNGIALYKSE
jgi:hypothetical protein